MSVSRKVLRKMKKVMGVISTIPVLAACSSQISRAYGEVRATFDYFTGTLRFSGNGVIDKSWQECYNKNSIRRVVVENGIKEIGKEAFSACRSLEKINIPNSVNTIGELAFKACNSLKKINIPNSVDIIGKGTFACCNSLTKIDIPNSVGIIDKFSFFGCTSLKEITIPSSVNIIGDCAFFYCTELETVKFEDMLRRDWNSCCNVVLHQFAFSKCAKLRLLDISGRGTNMSRIVKVEKDAFWGCDPNFVALEGSTVRGWFYSDDILDHVTARKFLVDSINDRINKKNSFFKKG